MIEAYDEHDISCLSGSDEHVAKETYMVSDIEETQTMIKGILSDE